MTGRARRPDDRTSLSPSAPAGPRSFQGTPASLDSGFEGRPQAAPPTDLQLQDHMQKSGKGAQTGSREPGACSGSKEACSCPEACPKDMDNPQPSLPSGAPFLPGPGPRTGAGGGPPASARRLAPEAVSPQMEAGHPSLLRAQELGAQGAVRLTRLPHHRSI